MQGGTTPYKKIKQTSVILVRRAYVHGQDALQVDVGIRKRFAGYRYQRLRGH